MNNNDKFWLYQRFDKDTKDAIRRIESYCLPDDLSWQLIFWSVWEWATKQEWWAEFTDWVAPDELNIAQYLNVIINPARFLELIVKFLRERGERR